MFHDLKVVVVRNFVFQQFQNLTRISRNVEKRCCPASISTLEMGWFCVFSANATIIVNTETCIFRSVFAILTSLLEYSCRCVANRGSSGNNSRLRAIAVIAQPFPRPQNVLVPRNLRSNFLYMKRICYGNLLMLPIITVEKTMFLTPHVKSIDSVGRIALICSDVVKFEHCIKKSRSILRGNFHIITATLYYNWWAMYLGSFVALPIRLYAFIAMCIASIHDQ